MRGWKRWWRRRRCRRWRRRTGCFWESSVLDDCEEVCGVGSQSRWRRRRWGRNGRQREAEGSARSFHPAFLGGAPGGSEVVECGRIAGGGGGKVGAGSSDALGIPQPPRETAFGWNGVAIGERAGGGGASPAGVEVEAVMGLATADVFHPGERESSSRTGDLGVGSVDVDGGAGGAVGSTEERGSTDAS